MEKGQLPDSLPPANDVNCDRMRGHDSRTTFMGWFSGLVRSDYPERDQSRLDLPPKPDRVCADPSDTTDRTSLLGNSCRRWTQNRL